VKRAISPPLFTRRLAILTWTPAPDAATAPMLVPLKCPICSTWDWTTGKSPIKVTLRLTRALTPSASWINHPARPPVRPGSTPMATFPWPPKAVSRRLWRLSLTFCLCREPSAGSALIPARKTAGAARWMNRYPLDLSSKFQLIQIRLTSCRMKNEKNYSDQTKCERC